MIEVEHLVKRAARGDDKAFERLVEYYQHMVYTLCMKMLNHSGRAEETAQDVFIKCYNALSTFDGRSKFSTWLYRITYNACLDHLNSERGKQLMNLDQLGDNQLGTQRNRDPLELEDRRNIVLRAIDSLKEENRIIVMLYYYEEMSLKEIAGIIGLKPNYVKVKLHRCRKALAGKLEDKLSII